MVKSTSEVEQPARLKAILFCAPGLFDLTGQNRIASTVLPSVLKPSQIPEPFSFSSTVLDPSIEPLEVPTYFGSPPSQNSLPWHAHPASLILGESIQYLFSDNIALSAREILYHANSQYVPRDLLPLSSGIDAKVSETTWLLLLPNENLPFWGTLRNAELTLISILLRAQSRIETWITISSDRASGRAACLLNKIQISESKVSHWKLKASDHPIQSISGSAQLSFQPSPESPKGHIFQSYEIDPTNHSFIFHPFQRVLDLVRQSLAHILERPCEEIYSHKDGKNFEITFPLEGHSIIQQAVEWVDAKLVQQGLEPIEKIGFQEIPESKIEKTIWMELDGKIRFCRRIRSRERVYEIWNFPGVTTLLVQGLTGGLGATSRVEIKNLAQDRRGHKRDRDLKVLRHNGFFALILFEGCSYILDGKGMDGIPFKSDQAFFDRLFERMGILLYEIERKAGFIDLNPAPPIDKLCSKNVTDLIRTFVSNLAQGAQSGTDSVFTSEGEIRLYGGTKVVLNIFQSLLSQIATRSGGQCFLKPRWNTFSSFLEKTEVVQSNPLIVCPILDNHPPSLTSVILPPKVAAFYQSSNSWIPAALALQALLPLHEKEFHFFYNQMSLNEMDPNDFKPEFNLAEPSINDLTHENTIDWFELHPKFFFKGVEIDASHLERISKEGILEFQGKVYLIRDKNLPSVKRLETFWAKIQTSNSSGMKRKKSESLLQIPKSHILEMLALRATGVQINGGDRWQNICRFYDQLDKPREPLDLPSTIHAELKPYQKIGVQWLLDIFKLGLGGILADDMGLGKTIQTLTFLEILRTQHTMGKTLIVVPTSLTYNWLSESNRFTPQIPIQIFQGKQKNNLIAFLAENKNAALICTYGLFTEHHEFFSSQKWNILIFDEAQNLKNITAKRTTVSRSISAHFKLCLTGTPLENHLGEFYSLLDLAVSGSLGDLSSFREKFVTPDLLNRDDLNYLKLKAKPLVLRRTKSEILSELPPKLESTIRLPFEQKQEKIYRDIALSWNAKVKESILSQGESKSQLLMLTALLRLRQACSDPAAIPHVRYSEEPPKVTVLLEALEEITESGESALVFTQFLHTFSRIRKELGVKNILFFSLHGGTSRKEREQVLRSFQESPRGAVLLMTLKTGGVGLNLVKASYVFHLEPWWNPAVENQATDRAHRIGQQKPVQVYRYLMRESVEEKIEILKERKSARFNSLFSSSESDAELLSGGAHLSKSDFDFLLS